MVHLLRCQDSDWSFHGAPRHSLRQSHHLMVPRNAWSANNYSVPRNACAKAGGLWAPFLRWDSVQKVQSVQLFRDFSFLLSELYDDELYDNDHNTSVSQLSQAAAGLCLTYSSCLRQERSLAIGNGTEVFLRWAQLLRVCWYLSCSTYELQGWFAFCSLLWIQYLFFS